MKVDLAIIGGGGAGFAAAAKANELGRTAVLINRGLPLGGTCVNVGCVPSKFFLELSSDYSRALHPRFQSLAPVTPRFSLASVIEEKEGLVLRNRNSKYRDVLSSYKNVTLIEELAHFEALGVIRAGNHTIEAAHTLIATGSSNKLPPLPGLEKLDKRDFLDNIEAFRLKELPKSMLVLGAGPTGLEVAQIFSRLGTKITVIEAKDRVFSVTEPEVSRAMEAILRNEGIDVYTNTKAMSVRKENTEVVLAIASRDKELEFRAEKLFIATGIKGNTEKLNLSAIGLKPDRNGFIDVDEHFETKVPGVWAAGDVAGPPWLETLAAREGALAIESAFVGKKRSINYDAVPGAVFTEPQMAVVGLTEEEVVKRFGSCDCRTVSLKFLPKADITNQTQGAAKMVIHPETQKILGFHLVCPNAAEIIHEPALAIQHGLTVDDIINSVHVFPTYSEIVKITAQAFRRDVERMSCCVE